MRNTFFDLDQDSTIVSMLELRDTRDAVRPGKDPLPLLVALGCVAALSLVLYLSASAA